MKLYITLTSPYARLDRIMVIEKELVTKGIDSELPSVAFAIANGGNTADPSAMHAQIEEGAATLSF